MNAHEFINNDLEFDVNNLYIPITGVFKGMLDERDVATNNEPMEEV